MALPTTYKQWNTVLSRALSIDKTLALKHCPPHLMPLNGLTGQSVTRWGSPGTKPNPEERGSAVLVLLSPFQRKLPGGGGNTPITAVDTNDLFLTLTMRSSKLKSHGGQMSFPGGRCDRRVGDDTKWETAVEAAVREAEEEVGLQPGSYSVLGQLSPMWSIPSKSWVTPVVALGIEGDPSQTQEEGGIVPPLSHAHVHNASPDEVESLHYISIRDLLTDSNRTHHQQVVHYEPTPGAGFKIPLVMPCFFASNVSPVENEGNTEYLLPETKDVPAVGELPPAAEMQPFCESDSPYFAQSLDGSKRPLKLVDKGAFTGVSLTWGMTAFMIAELTCRLAVSLRLPDVPLFDMEATDIENAAEGLSTRLPCSGLVLRDESHPKGISRPKK